MKHSSRSPGRSSPGNPSPGRQLALAIAGLALAVAALAYVLQSPPASPTAAPTTAATPPAPSGVATPASAPAAPALPAFQKLAGRWQRPDGGYVLALSDVTADGQLRAEYFNPKSIHVGRAEASRDGANLKVFVELQDVNYPGSTYTLTYSPETERLQGIYFQAALNQRYDVMFLRLP